MNLEFTQRHRGKETKQHPQTVDSLSSERQLLGASVRPRCQMLMRVLHSGGQRPSKKQGGPLFGRPPLIGRDTRLILGRDVMDRSQLAFLLSHLFRRCISRLFQARG